MSILSFTLQGDIAFWRDFEDSVGNLTCLGPAPSHILGIIGACFGWSSTNQPHYQKGEAPWPFASRLKVWVGKNRPKVAARLLQIPQRISLNVNGFKNAQTLDYTRIQQSVLQDPLYQVAVKLDGNEETRKLESVLKNPIFRVCMGSQFCPAFIREVAQLDANSKANWALLSRAIGSDSTPLTVLDLSNSKNRVHKVAYWNYLDAGETPVEQALVDAFHGA